MADSREDIASQGFGLLRADSVADFNEGTNEADIATLFYPDFVLDILTRYMWSFATKKRRLNQDSTGPVNEFQYSHILPGEAQRVWAIYNSDAVGAVPIKQYDIAHADGGRRVYSNCAELWAEYTIYASEAVWPGYFVHFAIHAWAALTAMTVTDQPDVAAKYQVLAWGQPNENEQGGKFGVACKIDAMQKPGEQIQSSPLVEARFS